MEEENVQAQEMEVQADSPEVVENQEETVEQTEPQDDTVTLKKSDFSKLNRKAIAYDSTKKELAKKTVLDVEDYIDISASLEGLDAKEKEYLAREHKLTGKPLKDIRTDENFLLWQSAYRQKVEKEQIALRPTSAQTEAEKPRGLMDKLRDADISTKEKLLIDAGLYKPPKARPDRTNIRG